MYVCVCVCLRTYKYIYGILAAPSEYWLIDHDRRATNYYYSKAFCYASLI